MKTILLASLAVLLLVTSAVGQKAKSEKISYTYKMYPWVKYDAGINSFNVEVNYEHAFLKGELNLRTDTATNVTVYSFSEKDILSVIDVNGLARTDNDGLKVTIDVRSKGDATQIVADFDKKTKEMVSAENPMALLGKMKDKLVFADVKVYEGSNLIASKNFEWKKEFQSDYLSYYMNQNKIKAYETYDNKINFADNYAKALYLIGGEIYYTRTDINAFLNQYIGTNDVSFEIPVYTAKMKKTDYSKLDDLQKKALNAIKSGNKNSLKEYVNSWLEISKKADFTNKKAPYNTTVVSAIYENCLYACFVTEDFDLYRTVLTEINTNKANLKRGQIKDIDKVISWIESLEKNRKINSHRF